MGSTVETLSRDRSILSMTTPLGHDALIPTAFGGQEALSEPFLFIVDMVAEAASIDPDRLLRANVTVAIRYRDGAGEAPLSARYFNGQVRRFVRTGLAGRRMTGYRAEIVPVLWFLSQTEDCRIFQNKTTEDICKALFSDVGLTDYEFRISGGKPVRDYTVQFNETDFAFYTRLLEEEGWFYFFDHTATTHKLVVADSANVVTAVPEPSSLSLGLHGNDGTDCLTAWEAAHSTAHGLVRSTDYDPTAPSKMLERSTATVLATPKTSERDAFRYPARSVEPGDVETRTRRRIEAAEAEAAMIEGAGQHEGFAPGLKFTLTTPPHAGSYALRSVAHQAHDESWIAGGATQSYANSFTCYPADLPWRPPLHGQKPSMAGVHSAVVIGPAGEEIHTDKYGRIKIQFHWDRRKDSKDDQSIWVRAMQPWTANTWGFQFLPRVGTEVAVAFLDADPDRPVVLGGLFNGEKMPVFALPDNKTKSGLRTRSTPGGGMEDFSELSFEDKKGSELVFLHAQKDHTVEVENDEAHTVDHDQTIEVKHDRTEKVGNDETVAVQQNRAVTIQQGNESLKVSQGNRSVDVAMGNDELKVDMGNYTVTVSLGNVSIKANVGSITLEALQGVTLKSGPTSSVAVTPEGVAIKGLMVSAEGTVQASVKGVITQVQGSGMLQLSGAITMIG